MLSVVDRNVVIRRIPVVRRNLISRCSAPVSLCAAVCRRDALTYLSYKCADSAEGAAAAATLFTYPAGRGSRIFGKLAQMTDCTSSRAGRQHF